MCLPLVAERRASSKRPHLAADAGVCDLGLVAFLLDGFLSDGARRLFVRVLGRLARAGPFEAQDEQAPPLLLTILTSQLDFVVSQESCRRGKPRPYGI